MAEETAPPASTPAATYGEMDFPEERKAELKAAFDKAAKDGRVEHKAVRCPLCPLCARSAEALLTGRGCRQAHALMFTAEERKEYGFGTFEEDLKATNDDCYGKGDMAWEDVEKRARGSRRSVLPWSPR